MQPKTLLLAVLLSGFGTGAAAQPVPDAATPACAAPAALPAGMGGWVERAAITAAGSAQTLPEAVLTPGKAVNAALLKTADVTYPLPPQKPGGAATYGGLFGFTVTAPGIYRVALDTAAWIDVVTDAKPVIASAHGHGPACSDIGKMVDFPLAAGPHSLQIAGAAKAAIAVMVTRLP